MDLYIIKESNRAAAYGIGTYISELTAALQDSEMNVCMIHLRSDKSKIEQEGSIRHIYIPSPARFDFSKSRDEQDELYYGDVVLQLQSYINNTERLVFHLNSLLNAILAKLLRKAFDCRIIVTVHTFNWGFYIFDNLPRLHHIFNEAQPDSFGERIKKSFEAEKSFFSFMDHIICLSNFMYDVLIRDYGLESSKVTFIPNGLVDNYNSTADIQQLREKWVLPTNEQIILFAGRMDVGKGLAYLLKAFRKVLSVRPQIRLVIAGEGAFNHYSKESQDICTRITYTGYLDKPQLYEWYRIADMGVVPSLFESFGYAAAEMMMHELPVVATATSGLDEVVDDSCGLKVPVSAYVGSVDINTDLLAENILYLLQHPAEAKEMGRNGRKRYLKEFTSEKFRRNMIRFYQSLQ